MILATRQSLTTGDVSSVSALNGKALEFDLAQQYAREFYRIVRGFEFPKDERIVLFKNRYFICVQYHPKRDDKNGICPVGILWDKDEKLEDVERTIEAMDLNVSRFRELYTQYQARRINQLLEQRKILLITSGVLAALCVIFLLILQY